MIYINLDPLVKRNSIFKMCLSDRGDGKTTELKRLALESFYESGKTAVFCRRFCSEMENDDFLQTFPANIEAAHPELLEGRKYAVKGSHKNTYGFFVSEVGGTELKKAISFLPLSMASKKKSAFDYKTHKNIYVDEYIPEDGIYLKNEARTLLNLYKTVDRNHEENYMIICGNKITRFNPVFDFFGVERFSTGLNSFQSGELDVLIYRNKGNAETATRSKFGDLVKGTTFEGYNAGDFLESEIDKIIFPSHSKNVVLKIYAKGEFFAAYTSGYGSGICIDKAQRPNEFETAFAAEQTNAKNVIDIRADNAKNVRKMLQFYRYNNRLFYASDNIYHKLKDFFKFI